MVVLIACSPKSERQNLEFVDVSVARVESITKPRVIRGVGTVKFRQETNLAFTSAGRIASIYVDVGQRVEKGQQLALLDTTTVSAQLSAANAEQVRAGAELQRSKQLYAQGWVSKARLDNAQAAYDTAIANIRARRFANETARIIASSSGVILSRLAEPTQVVSEGTPVLTLGEEARGHVLRIPVSDRDVNDIVAGAPATIRFPSLKDASVTGQVIQIGGRADQGTGTFEIEISLPKIAGLRSGQIGSAEIKLPDQSSSSLLLPPAALFAPRAGEGFVYVLPAGSDMISLRKVKIAEAADDGIRLLSGVAAGEWVVVSGVERMRDKQRVRAQRRIE
jgi:RND family efflux transporter MFP subunit